MTDEDRAYEETIQSANEGEEVPLGDLVAVPNVLGLGGLSAENLLEGMGFTVGFETIPSAEPGANIVLEQLPEPDTNVFLPASVLLRIGSGVPQLASPFPTSPTTPPEMILPD